jgi:predicted GNAT family acetyltransferase
MPPANVAYISRMTQAPSPVRDNPALSRFELDAEGHTAFSNYRLAPGVITFTHTEVPPQLRERGIGSALVQGALAAARARGLKVVPRCSFVAHYIGTHPEFQNLLD